MSLWLWIPLIVLAASICPLHMWWSQRRGRQAACCPPGRSDDTGSDLEELRTRQARLSAEISALEAARSEPVAAGEDRLLEG